MLKRRSIVSSRFVLTISVVYSIIIVLIVVAFLFILKINSDLLKETVLKNNDAYLTQKTGLIIERLKHEDIKKINDLSGKLKKYGKEDNELLYILIFSKTEDDNFFRIIDKVPFNPSLEIKMRTNKVIQEKKTNNYLKEGVFGLTFDPQIYSINDLYYKSIYHPYRVKDANLVIEFFISSSEVMTNLNEYSEKINSLKKFAIILAIGAAIAVSITSLIFIYNFSVLIKNLSGNIKKAAEESVELNLETAKDDDIKDLANSFNSIISELKEKKESSGELFKLGVDLLKEGNADSAINVFKTLTIIKPDSFAGYFNLGVAYAKKKQFTDSVSMFEKSLTINPGHPLTKEYIEKVNRLIKTNDGIS